MYAKNIHYTEVDFENIQDNYNGKAEYSNGYVVLSSNTSIQHNKIISRLNFRLMTFLDKSKCDVYMESIEVIFRNNEEVGDDVTGYDVLIYFGLSIIRLLMLFAVVV